MRTNKYLGRRGRVVIVSAIVMTLVALTKTAFLIAPAESFTIQTLFVLILGLPFMVASLMFAGLFLQGMVWLLFVLPISFIRHGEDYTTHEEYFESLTSFIQGSFLQLFGDRIEPNSVQDSDYEEALKSVEDYLDNSTGGI